ncbi:MAG: hypothetical protein P8Y69_14750, partial [Gammaproteobacteria bacterium]
MIGRTLAFVLSVAGASAVMAASADDGRIEEILVSGDAQLTGRLGEVGSWNAIDSDEVELIGAVHPTEALLRVPGVWISRGSGQEHLTA